MTSGRRNTAEITVITEIDGGKMIVNIMEEWNRKVLTPRLKGRKIKLRAAIIGRNSPWASGWTPMTATDPTCSSVLQRFN